MTFSRPARICLPVALLAGLLAGTGAAAQTASLNLPAQIEGSSQLSVTLSVSPAPVSNITIPLSSDSAALAVPASVVLQARSTSTKFTVQTAAVAANTKATLTAANIIARTVVLAPPRVVSLSFAPAAVNGGTGSTASVALSRVSAAGGVRVQVSSGDPFAAAVPATVQVAAGASAASFAIQTNPAVAQTRVAGIRSQVSGTPGVIANLTVNPAPIAVVALTVPAVVTQGTVSTAQVRLNRAASAATAVQIQKNFQNVTVPISVTVPAGADRLDFSISATGLPEEFSFGPTTIRASISAVGVDSNPFQVNGPPGSLQSITITADYPPGVAQTIQGQMPSITAGYKARATIRLNAPAPAGGKAFGIRNIQPQPCVSPDVTSVTVPAGATEAQMTFTTQKWFSLGTGVPSCIGNFAFDMAGGPTTQKFLAVKWPMVNAFSVAPDLIQAGENVVFSASIDAPAPPGGLRPAMFCTLFVPGVSSSGCGMQTHVAIAEGATTGTTVPMFLTAATNQTPVTQRYTWVASTMTDDPTRGISGSVEVVHLRPREIRTFRPDGTPTGVFQGGQPAVIRVDVGRPAITPLTIQVAGNVSFSTCSVGSPDPAASWFPAVVTVPAGEQFASFTVQTQPLACPVTVLATAAFNLSLGYQAFAQFTVNP